MDKKKYLLWAAKNYFSARVCPSCGSKASKTIDTKYIVTRLQECENCKLQFRHPVDDPEFNKIFYQKAYEEKGLTTDLPNDLQLKNYVENNFSGTEKDFSRHIASILSLFDKPEEVNVLDFGANWGYTSLQFKRKGFAVESFEISKERALFAKKLNVDVQSELKNITKGKNVFFSAHVIEHHPKISDMIGLAKDVLTKDGYFIAYCPNGSAHFRKLKPNEFHLFWGMVHPNYLSDTFYKHIFANNPYCIGSNVSEKEMFEKWDGKSQMIFDLSGPEIIVVAKPNTFL